MQEQVIKIPIFIMLFIILYLHEKIYKYLKSSTFLIKIDFNIIFTFKILFLNLHLNQYL